MKVQSTAELDFKQNLILMILAAIVAIAVTVPLTLALVNNKFTPQANAQTPQTAQNSSVGGHTAGCTVPGSAGGSAASGSQALSAVGGSFLPGSSFAAIADSASSSSAFAHSSSGNHTVTTNTTNNMTNSSNNNNEGLVNLTANNNDVGVLNDNNFLNNNSILSNNDVNTNVLNDNVVKTTVTDVVDSSVDVTSDLVGLITL